jgi:hypothetical protein
VAVGSLAEGDAKGLPDGREWISAVVLIGGLVSGLAYSAFYVHQHGVPDRFVEADEPASGGELRFTVDQVREFNSVYERRDLEWSWCMDVDSVNVTEVQNPRNTSTTERSASFYCTRERQFVAEGSVHTNPSGSAYFSSEDKESNLQFTCVVHGSLPEEPVSDPRSLKCIEHFENSGFEEIDVVVERR